MKITRIETIKLLVPLKPMLAIRNSHGVHSASPFLLALVHTDTGLVGLGEASCTPAWSGEDHTTAAHYIDTFLGPALIGRDPRDVARLSARIDGLLAGNTFTKAALQMALWDLLGKAAGLPLYRLWGGAVRANVPLKFSISGAEPEKAAAIAAWAVAQGFRTVKVKVGTGRAGAQAAGGAGAGATGAPPAGSGVEADVARVAAVRAEIGAGIRLGIDANGGWSVREAIAAVRAMQPLNLSFVEQPVPPDDPAWMAEVRRAIDLPIIADESVFSLPQAMAVTRLGAADVLSVYAGKGGGLLGARKMAVVAEAAGIVCTIGSNLELGVGSAAMIHLGMATAGIDAETFPCDIIGPYYYEADILAEPLPLRGGAAFPLERPGLGVELDMDVVDRFRVD